MAADKNTYRQQQLRPTTPERQRAIRRAQVSRRSFLKQSGGIAALTAGAGGANAALTGADARQEGAPQPVAPFEYAFDGVPETPVEPPPDSFEVLTEQEAAVVEALTARLMPGTPDDPGAREAGVVHYIDGLLAYNGGLREATYTAGPWARAYEGDAPPEEDDEEAIWVRADEIARYGYQAPLSPLQTYRIAIPVVQQHAEEKFGGGIEQLTDEDQDQVIRDLLDDEVEGFEQFPAVSFFHTLRRHTAEGMFSDPVYGGNREFAGWRLVGFPGAQRAYSPEELVTEDGPRSPQGMTELPEFNPGVSGHDDHHNVVQPVRQPDVDGGDGNGEPSDGDGEMNN